MDKNITEETKEFHGSHEVFVTIETFIQKQDQIKKISGLEKISFPDEIKKKEKQINSIDLDDGKELAKDLIRVKNQFLYCYRTIETKLKYISSANIYSLNHNNFLVLANNCRSLIEHTASITYQIKKGNECVEILEKSKDVKEARKALADYEEILIKVFYGTRFFKNEGLVDAINVLTLIDKYLTKELEEVRQFYDFLSDFVHPNFGSNILITSGSLAEGVVDPPFQEKKEIVKQILNGTQVIYSFLEKKIFDFAAIGIQMDDFLVKLFTESIKFCQIFENKDLSLTGDGKSKETAISFTNAITHGDFVKFQYEYLKSKLNLKDNEISGQRIGGIDGEFIYDVQLTVKGEIWFKTPRNKMTI